MGDERTYDDALALRAVHSRDGMTADWVPLPYDLLATISSRIINEVRGINRVVYDITSKPPGDDRVGVAPAQQGRRASRVLLAALAVALASATASGASRDADSLTSTQAGVTVDWMAGTLAAGGGAAANLRMPSVDLARPGAERARAPPPRRSSGPRSRRCPSAGGCR